MRTTGSTGSLWPAVARLLLLGAGVSLSLLVGMLMYLAAERTVNADARKKFDGVARSAQSSLAAGIRSYTDLLRGTGALFQSAQALPTRMQFRRYVTTLNVKTHFPAVESISFASYVTDVERAQFIAAVRGDTSADAGGHPEFTFSPPGQRAAYTVLNYMEPTAEQRGRMSTDLSADLVSAAPPTWAQWVSAFRCQRWCRGHSTKARCAACRSRSTRTARPARDSARQP